MRPVVVRCGDGNAEDVDGLLPGQTGDSSQVVNLEMDYVVAGVARLAKPRMVAESAASIPIS
jgi:hypothetical protein